MATLLNTMLCRGCVVKTVPCQSHKSAATYCVGYAESTRTGSAKLEIRSGKCETGK